jgi:hypothetical protein
MSDEMSLRQQITLAEFLASHFGKMRSEHLNPQAAQDMEIGERMAAKFGGIIAAWVSMPKPADRAGVKNKAAFLAWVKEHLPAEVDTVEVVRPGTQAALLQQAKANGGKWISPDGEAFEIAGIELSAGTPSPRVELTPDAGAAIVAAWQSGEINLAPMLALPGGGPGE